MNLSKNNSDLSRSPLKIGGGTPESARLPPLLGGLTGGGGEWRMHHVTCVTVLGVGLGPMAEAKIVLVVDLIGEARHISVFRKLFLAVEVEPRVPCVRVLGLVPILVGEEFDGGTFADFGVFDPVAGAFTVPLGRSFNVGGEVIC